MDYSLCKALNYNMKDIPVALVMYDIMCQYGVHLQGRVDRSPELSIPSSLELRTGIGLFHIHGHKDSCLPRFSPSYIPGAKQVDGEIIESLWAPLNHISRSARGMSLIHRQELLDAHMNHSNMKKMTDIGMMHPLHNVHCSYIYLPVPSLLRRFNRLETSMNLSAEAFASLSQRFKENIKEWLTAEKLAQLNRSIDSTAMDIYDTATAKGMNTESMI